MRRVCELAIVLVGLLGKVIGVPCEDVRDNEVIDVAVKNLRWQTGKQEGAGPYAFSSDQWVGYEDAASITEKVSTIRILINRGLEKKLRINYYLFVSLKSRRSA